ncbi:MAG: PxxKW family cysteine-rich protein [Deltaproteobacteria bacterium]|nr:PxxKW family cysteine-rich protein [Deltaproteobacteria bacterium]
MSSSKKTDSTAKKIVATPDFIGKAFKAIAEKCEGCDRVRPAEGQKFCSNFMDPSVRWRLGNCNMATHIKVEGKTDAGKVRVGQQKQKKK